MKLAVLVSAVALSVASPAVAGVRDAEQWIGTPSGDGQVSALSLATARDGATARLSFTVGSGVDAHVEVSVPLRLPAGARVTAMTTAIGKRTRSARELEADVARARFEHVLPRGLEPVLIEHVADGELRLRVSVSRKQRARITLALALVNDSVDWMTADPLERGHVSTQHSLLALAAPPRAAPAITISAPAMSVSCDFGGARPIRRFIKLQVPRLGACYSRALQGDHELAGTVVLHFSVAASGYVSNVSVDGTLTAPAVRECIVDDVERWTLPAAVDSSTLVINYPLTFVPPP